MTFFSDILVSLDQYRGTQNIWHNQPDSVPLHAAAPILSIEAMNFTYDQTRVLNDVNLTLFPGDCLALIGPNGGGKTTLLRLIAGLLTPSSGKISVCGHNAAPAKGHIGYVPQHMEIHKGFPITAMETVLMGTVRRSWLQGKPRKAEIEFAEAIMEKLGVEDIQRQRMDSLSGGQRQRILIARALMASPSMLIFDEPTSNIDPEGRYCFHELMSELSGSITMAVVSHDLSILSSGITCLAGVNGHLSFTKGTQPTQEILSLIYGQHAADCPMGAYLQELQNFHMQAHSHTNTPQTHDKDPAERHHA